MRKIYATLFCLMAFTIAAVAQDAAGLEARAQREQDRYSRMLLYRQAAEKYGSGNPEKASRTAHQAYLIALELEDNATAAQAAFLSAEGYARQGKYSDARLRFGWSKDRALEIGDVDGVVRALDRMAEMSRQLNDNAQAANYSNQAAEFKKKGKIAANYAVSTTGQSRPTSSSEMTAFREQMRRETEQLERERQSLRTQMEDLKKDRANISAEQISLQQKELAMSLKTQLARQTIEQQNAQLASMSLTQEEKDRLLAIKQQLVETLMTTNALDSIAFAQVRREQEAKLQAATYFRNVLILGLVFALVVAVLLYKRYIDNRAQQKALEAKNHIITDERQRSDDLLRNILPAAIADELKQNGKARAQRYEQASVMFVDFKGFTSISERLPPETLVAELDSYFKAFDFIIDQYNLEKIKTIGDAYMVASGLSDKTTSPLNMVRAALEMQEFMNDMKTDKQAQNMPFFEGRIGIHTGPVVAGVVGIRKFAYDIWGDTVNMAVRVQEACEPGQVNISEKTYNEVKYSFHCQYRGRFPVKNKGEIDMYYVKGVLK